MNKDRVPLSWAIAGEMLDRVEGYST
jgi:hypothetical protein